MDMTFSAGNSTGLANCFALSGDGKLLFLCGHWDNSFKCYQLKINSVSLYRRFYAHKGIQDDHSFTNHTCHRICHLKILKTL